MRVKSCGQKVYFPNLIFTLVRSGKQREAGEVVFRVPMFMNKLDIQHYLEGLYGLKVANVRTSIFLPRETRQGRHYTPGRKNAIVTLADGQDSSYPPPTDPSLLNYPLLNQIRYPKAH